jgi:hypothetical protein
MPSLYAYRIVIDSVTTHALRLPTTEAGQMAGQELCHLPDGRTVAVVFDGHTLPADQPAAIAASIELLPSPLPPELRAQIREASPHCRLIAKRLVERIRAKYSQDDEQYLTRIACGKALGTYTFLPGEEDMIADYQATAEAARAWAKAERAKLGV